MPRKKLVVTKSTGLALEVPVIEFLDKWKLQQRARDRSAVLNLIIREFATLKGVQIPSAAIQPSLAIHVPARE